MKRKWKSYVDAEKGYDSPIKPEDLRSAHNGDIRRESIGYFQAACFSIGRRKPEYLPLREDKLIPGSQEALDRMRFLAEHEQPLFEY